jgi:hypothetical protein
MKSTYSFRISDEHAGWLEDAHEAIGTTKSGLLEDALELAEQTNNAAAANLGSLWRAMAERYGEDAEVTTWVDLEDDGLPVVRVRVNGEEQPELRGHVTIDEKRGKAHVFLELDGWTIVRYGSAYLGPSMVATLPLRSSVTFPWPPDPVHRTAAVARIGDVIHGGARSPEPDPAA